MLAFAGHVSEFTKNRNDQWNHAGGFSISIAQVFL